MADESNWVPLDILTREELYVIVHKAIGNDVTQAVKDKMTDALVHHQGGIDHFLGQAWEKGVSDYRGALEYPWILSHMVNPYENPVDNPDDED